METRLRTRRATKGRSREGAMERTPATGLPRGRVRNETTIPKPIRRSRASLRVRTTDWTPSSICNASNSS
ncbi:hypothetical protein CMUS01_15718 [Colletotrichum musicola]|uniref:Uncharacterized protein n=1 Tax=Colletotrichum musicola TaxID=2175873 RepID=A0A8H6IU39_9PEZI|nr:hypothetical protein CMUS01_15718 [Colletotrichum musicola]